MTSGENLRRAVQFDAPDWIPMTFHINPACWQHYPPAALQELMAKHALLFPGYNRKQPWGPVFSAVQRKDEPYRDPWGCVWSTSLDGITGCVTTHPLEDWAAFDTYVPPDPERTDGLIPVDWEEVADDMRAARGRGEVAQASLRHGHTFMQLCDIRGYENLLLDMVDDEPLLARLIDMLELFNLGLVRRYLEAGAEWLSYPEDLGMQSGPMISPDLFRKYIKPTYQRLIAPAREAGCIIHMHSDGDIRTLAQDLIEGGVEVLNLQDLVNGLDWIADSLKGRVCIELDVDRQTITRFGTPAQIDALIREEVEKLGSRRGGLMLIYGLYPGVPLQNVRALMEAMERYAGHHN
jgi:uroporphyrinogen decarboxylase